MKLRTMGRVFLFYGRVPVGLVVFSDVVCGCARNAIHWVWLISIIKRLGIHFTYAILFVRLGIQFKCRTHPPDSDELSIVSVGLEYLYYVTGNFSDDVGF